MALLNSHLDDAALTEVWTDRALGAEASRPAETHLLACAECQSRYASLREWLETVRTDARAEADEVFGAERLGAQQAQILRRLEALEHPARVIAFPRFAQPVGSQPHAARRWVAMAAAAGLVVGVGLGRVLEFGAMIPTGQNAPQMVATTRPAADAPLLAVQPLALVGDETFLDEPPAVTQPRVPESLQYLNAVTPTSRDFEPQ